MNSARHTEKPRLLSDVELEDLKAEMERASKLMRQELARRRQAHSSADLNKPMLHGPR